MNPKSLSVAYAVKRKMAKGHAMGGMIEPMEEQEMLSEHPVVNAIMRSRMASQAPNLKEESIEEEPLDLDSGEDDFLTEEPPVQTHSEMLHSIMHGKRMAGIKQPA